MLRSTRYAAKKPTPTSIATHAVGEAKALATPKGNKTNSARTTLDVDDG
jgi:hypothetical protein